MARGLRWAALCTLISPLASHAGLFEGLQDLASGQHEWEGAIGAVVSEGPSYLGSGDYGFGFRPALFLRYGRFSLVSGAGFATRRADQELRGLGVRLVDDDDFKLGLAVRLDRGRDASSTAELEGLGNIDPTLRLRVSGRWQLDDGWVLGALLSIDALGRGQGAVAELSFARERFLTPDLIWTWGGSLSAGNATYMQSWYGVTPEQSLSSGYPVYTPSLGLRDVALSTGLRAEITPEWVGFVNVGVSQALGPVRGSPIVFRPLGGAVNAGLAWRF